MHTNTLGVAIAVVSALGASGQIPATSQTPNEAAYAGKPLDGSADAVRLFYLTHGETSQEIQDLANVIRATADVHRTFAYGTRRTLAVRGTPDQIALAEWLFARLDKPVDPQAAKTAAYDFPAPGGAVDAVRVFYFTQDPVSENLQQMINLIRTTADIQRAVSYNARGAIVVRGTPAQIALAEWLFGQLDKPVNPQNNRTEAYEQRVPSGRGDAIRLFFFAYNETQNDLNEIMQMIRTTSDIQAITSYGPRRAIALRGNPAQIALAEWLVNQLGAAASRQGRR